jgi:phytol kinase
MALLLTILAVLALLLINEIWWRARDVHDELSRKFIHISVGSFVAFWPLFLSWQQIRLLSVAFLIAVVISKYFKVFQAIHSVQRPTWGEVFFAAAVGLVTFITEDPAVYAAALLQMSLADGLAAVFGHKYGQSQRYQVFGHTKSVLGTMTFCMVSVAILFGVSERFDSQLGGGLIVGVSAIAALVENLGVRGFDNLLVPVLTAVLLTYL